MKKLNDAEAKEHEIDSHLRKFSLVIWTSILTYLLTYLLTNPLRSRWNI